MHHTLHEFFTATKGVEYLIAVTFLVLFPIYWSLINRKKKEEEAKSEASD